MDEYGGPKWIATHATQVAKAMQTARVVDYVTYLDQARRVTKHLGRRGTEAYRGNVDTLTEHASLLRSLGAMLIFIEGGINALNVHPESEAIRRYTAEACGYVDAQLKALRFRLEQ